MYWKTLDNSIFQKYFREQFQNKALISLSLNFFHFPFGYHIPKFFISHQCHFPSKCTRQPYLEVEKGGGGNTSGLALKTREKWNKIKLFLQVFIYLKRFHISLEFSVLWLGVQRLKFLPLFQMKDLHTSSKVEVDVEELKA